MFKNLRFKKKLFLSYLVVIIIPITVLGLYSYNQAERFLLNQQMQGLSESVRQISENLNYKLNRYNTVISFLVFNSQIIQIVNNQDANYFDKYISFSGTLDPLINTILSTNNDIDKILIYTNNSNLTERADSINSLSRIERAPWFSRVITQRKLHWVIENRELTGFFRFPEPYKHAPLNLLSIKMKYDKVFDIHINKLSEYGIFVSDHENDILFSKNTIGNKKLHEQESTIIVSEEGKATINGVDCILIKKRIEEAGWNLYFYSPVSSVVIDASEIIKATIIIIFLCLGILILITFVFSNTFVKRIDNLNKKMKIVEDGNLRINVFSSSKDEIGELTNSFGKMLNKINTLIDEVYSSKIVQKEAELKALQAQINPHFLYNTLSLINWKAITIDAMEISQITTNVSKFYRTILNKGRDVISVKDEVALTKCYIEIQLALHKNSFDVEYYISDEIYSYYMNKIILQPIVENAIEHGIDHKLEGRGKLILSGYTHNGSLYFKIQDNGPGFPKEKIHTIFSTDTGGYGLKNVQERIRFFFGDEYGMSIADEKGMGTCVTVKIPQYSQ